MQFGKEKLKDMKSEFLPLIEEIKKNSKLYAIKILKMLRKVGRLDPSVVIPEIPLTDPINLDSAGYLWRYNYEKQDLF